MRSTLLTSTRTSSISKTYIKKKPRMTVNSCNASIEEEEVNVWGLNQASMESSRLVTSPD